MVIRFNLKMMDLVFGKVWKTREWTHATPKLTHARTVQMSRDGYLTPFYSIWFVLAASVCVSVWFFLSAPIAQLNCSCMFSFCALTLVGAFFFSWNDSFPVYLWLKQLSKKAFVFAPRFPLCSVMFLMSFDTDRHLTPRLKVGLCRRKLRFQMLSSNNNL